MNLLLLIKVLNLFGDISRFFDFSNLISAANEINFIRATASPVVYIHGHVASGPSTSESHLGPLSRKKTLILWRLRLFSPRQSSLRAARDRIRPEALRLECGGIATDDRQPPTLWPYRKATRRI